MIKIGNSNNSVPVNRGGVVHTPIKLSLVIASLLAVVLMTGGLIFAASPAWPAEDKKPIPQTLFTNVNNVQGEVA